MKWPDPFYVSLHTADPGKAGKNEVVGNGYARQPGSFGASSENEVSNICDIDFRKMPRVVVTHIGIWSSRDSDAGFMYGFSLTSSKELAPGCTFRLPAGDLCIAYKRGAQNESL